MGTLKLRYQKVAFYGVPASGGSGEPTYTRMHGFTEMSNQKNAATYDRRYVDRKSNDVDVTGYAPTTSFSFDEISDDAVCTDIVNIIDGELIGSDAVRSIVVVDFSKPVSGSQNTYEAYERKWSITGDTDGSGTEAYTYSGSFNSKSEKVTGTATVATPAGGDNETAETVTFTKNSGE